MPTINGSRVPHIIILYWVIKIAATTLGETGADMFSMTLNLGYFSTIMLFLGLLLVCLAIKLYLRRYEPVSYWATFTATAIAGTAISDFIDRTLGLGYATGAIILLILLGVVLVLWWLQERSLSVERIFTPRAELYYWAAFLVANTLGTAAGDYLADDLELGFAQSAMMIGAVLVLLVILHYKTALSTIMLFWMAFVLTRPFGATFGDLLTKTTEQGGLGFGTIGASAVFTVMLLVALYLEVKRERALAN